MARKRVQQREDRLAERDRESHRFVPALTPTMSIWKVLDVTPRQHDLHLQYLESPRNSTQAMVEAQVAELQGLILEEEGAVLIGVFPTEDVE